MGVHRVNYLIRFSVGVCGIHSCTLDEGTFYIRAMDAIFKDENVLNASKNRLCEVLFACRSVHSSFMCHCFIVSRSERN